MERPDWRHLVQARAARGGARLPDRTVHELAEHLDDVYQDALDAGASETSAEAAALHTLDAAPIAGPPLMNASLVRLPGGRVLGVLSHVCRAASGPFRRRLSFALVVTMVLGLSIAAAMTVFAVLDSVVLRPLPYTAPDRLVTLWDVNPGLGLARERISPVNFMDYRALPGVQDAAAWWRPSLALTDPGLDPLRVNAVETTANLFTVLGVSPQLGTGFAVQDALFVPNQPTIVISDRLWRTRYDADPAILGRLLRLNGTGHTVVGVMPPGFRYPDDIDIWQRLQWDPQRHSRAAHFMEGVVRLRPSTALDQAQRDADALAARLQSEFAATNAGWGVRLVPLLEAQLGYLRPAILVLSSAVGLLLLIACLNIASLHLVHAVSREREMAVRIALGASPRRLAGHLLAESFGLSLAGAGVGLTLTTVLLPVLVRSTPVDVPRLGESALDGRAFVLAIGVVLLTTIGFGLVPALVLLRRRVVVDLKSGASTGRRAQWAYSAFVASEVALACALLTASALLLQTVTRMLNTPTGVDADEVVVATVQLPEGGYRTWGDVADTYAALLERLQSQPGVSAAGVGNVMPLEPGWRLPFGIVGAATPAREEDAPQSQVISVSDGYFASLGVQPVSGRAFTRLDTRASAPVVMVNASFAERYLGGRAAVGRQLSTTAIVMGPLGVNLFRVPATVGATLSSSQLLPPRSFEVVGVVPDVRNAPLGQQVEPAIYFAASQFPFREMYITVRATTPSAGMSAVRAALADVAPEVPVGRAGTWEARVAQAAAEERLLTSILAVFGGLAALLAALGVYGLLSWVVARRTRELAIRLTLGARPLEVGGLVIRYTALLVAAGLVGGVSLVALAGRWLSQVLYDVTPTDTLAVVSASLVLTLAAAAACLPPALRVMRMDPGTGLRAE